MPLVMYDPRLNQAQRGKTVSEMSLNIDIAPTILDLAGSAIPEGMQGESLLPLVNGQEKQWRKDFLVEHLFEYEPIPKSEAVRTDKWKYSRYYADGTIHEQLYNIEKDPKEVHDLASDKKYQEILVQLRTRCNKLVKTSS